jgi:hypothetical protein
LPCWNSQREASTRRLLCILPLPKWSMLILFDHVTPRGVARSLKGHTVALGVGAATSHATASWRWPTTLWGRERGCNISTRLCRLLPLPPRGADAGAPATVDRLPRWHRSCPARRAQAGRCADPNACRRRGAEERSPPENPGIDWRASGQPWRRFRETGWDKPTNGDLPADYQSAPRGR